MTGCAAEGKLPLRWPGSSTRPPATGRISDVLTLLHPDVDCEPLIRPGQSLYHGREQVTRMLADAYTVRGRFQIELISVTEQDGPQVTALASVTPGPGYGQPVQVRSVFRFRDGLVSSIVSTPGDEDRLPP